MTLSSPSLSVLLSTALAISGLSAGLFSQSRVTPTALTAATTLSSLATARGFTIGAGASDPQELGDKTYANLAATQYNAIEPGNVMKMYVMEPSQGVYDLSQADEVVRFAQANGLKVTASAPIWDGNPTDYGTGNPSWLSTGKFTATQLKIVLQSYITTIMQHYHRNYPGVVNRWSVVSEATHLCGPFCAGLGKDASGFPAYVALAYEDARAADPTVQLCYDDFGGEGLGETSEKVYKLVSYLKSKGLVDCVGLEGQWEGDGVSKIPPAAEITANVNRLGALGLSVYFSQVEIGLPVAEGFGGGVASEADQTAQANAYSTLLRTCLSTVACKGFFTWGITDKYAFCYKAGMCAPLPFDANCHPKPAYYAVRSALGR
ncbi:MAG: endo-1,4-beta-xylanase [Terracidiphilus sp.]